MLIVFHADSNHCCDINYQLAGRFVWEHLLLNHLNMVDLNKRRHCIRPVLHQDEGGIGKSIHVAQFPETQEIY